MLVKVKDESLAGDILNEIELAIKNEIMTVREFISIRVETEVKAYNEKADSLFRGLVRPTETEKTLNGYKLKTKRMIDVEKQIFVAFDAFQKNGFILLIDNQQVESLDQKILIEKDTPVSFVKLTPLVGG